VQENNELLDQQSHNQIGWVYNNKRRLFKTPYLKGNDTADVIGQAKWLNHTFVKIVAQADTADGRYYQVQLPQQAQLGWLKASSVLPMQMGKHFAIYQWLWNQLSHKVPEQQYDVGIRQLFTILEPAVLTNQPLGLTKRGLKQRQLTTINQFYLATAVAKTKVGTYYRVKVGKKQWWIDAKSVKLQVVNVPLQVNQSIVLQDYLENALILNAAAKDKVQDAFGLIPADLQIIAGYATAKFIGDQQVYELKSESLGEQISLPITMVMVLDTSHFNYYYVVTKAFEATYYRTLVDKQAQTIVIADQIIELARVWNWETNDFMIFALIANQYVWIAESIIHHKHVKQTMFEEDKLVDEQSGVQLEADVLPVDKVRPVSMLAKPWITRKIDMHVADNYFISLIRQNGTTTLVTDDGQKRKIADIHQGISKQLIYANGRNWATYEHFVFVAVGRLSPEKNQTMLLDAFAKVYQQHPEAELIIVGDGVIRGDLEKQAVQLGIADVVLFTGQVDNPADYLAVADVFVHPSLYEGQPMVLLEAMMQHRLIVATNIAANVGVLGNQTYGLLTQDVTTDAFVSQMLFAIEQQTEIAEFDIKHYQNDARLAFYNIIK
jgi:glycosyltransferase involved in cell wall biosynthesis